MPCRTNRVLGPVLLAVGLTLLGTRFQGAGLAGANAAFVTLYNAGMVIGPPAVGTGFDLLRPHGFALVLAAFFATHLLLALRDLGARART